MKKIAFLLILIAMSQILAACAPIDSLQALYTTDDKAFEESLLGKWQIKEAESDDDKKARWIFERSADEKSYSLCLTSIEKKGCLLAKARLVRLGGAFFVDFEGDTDDDRLASGNGFVPFPVVSTHMIGRIWIDKDVFRIHLLKDDWVKQQIKSGKFTLPYVDVDGRPILTAKTEELRKFAQEHMEDQEAFSQDWELVRVK